MFCRVVKLPLLLALIAASAAAGLAEATSSRPPAVAPGFHVVVRYISLPTACAQRAVRNKVVELLREFRSGSGASFARRFTPEAVFQPYNGTSLAPPGTAPGRGGISRFVLRRHAAGDVWTGTALIPPTSSNRVVAIYGLNLQVLIRQRTFKHRAAKVVVRCDSGEIRAWVGPVIPRLSG